MGELGMKALEAMVAWTSTASYDDPTQGKIEVGPWPDTVGWSDKYSSTVGACFQERHNLPEWGVIAMVFIDFHTAVVGYGIDPVAAHTEFLKIDEYRRKISPDIEGAE